MMRRRCWLRAASTALAGGAVAAVAPAFATSRPGAADDASHPWLPQSRRIGQATLRMLGFHIYDAQLFGLANFDPAGFAMHPIVLELHYRRAFSGADIAGYSLKEMRRAPASGTSGAGGNGSASEALDAAVAERWLQFMQRAFPDVRPGDRLTGQWLPGSGTSRFAANDSTPVELQDPAFGPRFFGIWLAPHTPRPDLREQLLGLRKPS